MRGISAAAVVLALLLAATTAFGQAGNGQVFGSVQDMSKALMPGVTITLTNKDTNVTDTRISNDSGAYTFPSVPPGTYKITAELPGFKVSAADNLEVGASGQVRWNFSMEVGTVSNQIEVSVAADQLITETSDSVGTVLSQQRVTDLPLVGQNVLDVLQTLPGFRQSLTGNDNQSTVGGMSLDTVNTTINGLTTVSSRDSASLWGRQTMTTAVINPDMVGEMRLITTPVDAELGRGNAQVQIQTRSGTNQFRGSGVWNLQNSALNANSWVNNSNAGAAIKPNWYNLNQLTGSVGGPIIKNKTFFYALYDKQLINRRSLVSTAVLTDTARNGVWRYWEGWNPAPALTAPPLTFATVGATPTGSMASVDTLGNPLAPIYNPTGGPYTLGGMHCFSVFGNVKVDGTPFTQADCPGGTAAINPTPWDPLRSTVDQTGIIKNVLSLMPHANFFANTGAAGTDGLNLATYRYLQGTHGPDPSSINADIGVAQSELDLNERNQFNGKIDHNFNQKHRVAVNVTYERTGGQTSLAGWGTGLNGDVRRRPYFIIANFTSTLSPTLLNEARFGLNYSNEFATSPWDNLSNPSVAAAAQKYIYYGGTNPNNGKKYPILFNPGTGWNGFMSLSAFDFGNLTPLWEYGDTIRWTHGKHSISAGGEYRRPETTGYNSSPYISTLVGNASATTAQFFSSGNLAAGASQLPNFLATTRGLAGTFLNTFNGAIQGTTANTAPSTTYWINGQSDINNGVWQDVTTANNTIPSADKYGHQTRSQIQQEWGFFVKDDFKVHPTLTLNIGIRWDLTRSPYFSGLNKGLTNRFAGDGLGLFGAGRPSGSNPFQNWLTPGNLYLSGYGSNTSSPLACVQGTANPNGIPASSCNPSLMSTIVYVGPGSDHPNQSLVPESGRFSPALGAAWEVPWFGKGKTTIRGGFQRTYGQAASLFTGGLLSGPGADGSSATNLSSPAVASILTQRALNLTDLPLLVPAPPTIKPTNIVEPVGAQRYSSTYAMYAPNYQTPYTDNYTLSITRRLTKAVTMELRSINTKANGYGPSVGNAYTTGGGGSFGTAGTFDINTINVFHNTEAFNAFQNARAGIDDPLWDQMLMGVNLNPTIAGYGPVGTTVNGVLQRGAAQLRKAYAVPMANGQYVSVVQSLLAANNSTGLQTLPIDPSTGLLLSTSQRVLRNGCDRLANGLTGGFTDPNTGNPVGPRCFPENYFIANPQLGTGNGGATVGAEYAENLGYTNYHAFEAQFTLRPTYGSTLQATYGFSKTMAQPGSLFTDPLNPQLDYGRTVGSVGSDFRMNGVAELPVGPNRLLLAGTHGWLARAVEHWQTGFIFQVAQGAPRSFLTGNNFLYTNGRPNIVGPWNNPQGHVTWNGNTGYYFGNTQYATFQDPQCQNVTTKDGLQANCSLVGLAQVAAQGTPGTVPLSQGRVGIPLLENPQPGTQGNLGNLTMATFPRFALDGNISKTIQISETKSVQIRFDATNILNHATPSDPVGLANAASAATATAAASSSFQNALGNGFGTIQTTSAAAPGKTGQNGSTLGRTFQAKIRINF